MFDFKKLGYALPGFVAVGLEIDKNGFLYTTNYAGKTIWKIDPRYENEFIMIFETRFTSKIIFTEHQLLQFLLKCRTKDSVAFHLEDQNEIHYSLSQYRISLMFY